MTLKRHIDSATNYYLIDLHRFPANRVSMEDHVISHPAAHDIIPPRITNLAAVVSVLQLNSTFIPC